MRFFLLCSLFFWSISCWAQQAKKLHFKSVLADTHNDVLSSAVLDGVDISYHTSIGHSDLERWKAGGLDLQFFSVWTDAKPRTAKGFFNDALEEIHMLDTLIAKNASRMMLARTYKDVKKGLRQDKLVSLIGVEGGHMIENDLNKLMEL